MFVIANEVHGYKNQFTLPSHIHRPNRAAIFAIRERLYSSMLTAVIDLKYFTRSCSKLKTL